MGKNLVPPVTLRLDQNTRDWLVQQALDQEIPLNAFVKKLLREYRAKVEQQNNQQKGQ